MANVKFHMNFAPKVGAVVEFKAGDALHGYSRKFAKVRTVRAREVRSGGICGDTYICTGIEISHDRYRAAEEAMWAANEGKSPADQRGIENFLS